MPENSILRISILISVAVVGCVAVYSYGPIPQDAAYHSFADQRTLLGVPNFWNVASNLGFLMAGIAGIRELRSPSAQGTLTALRPAFVAFFLGALGVAVGSGYDHLRPSNETLLFDRLPMTIAFMAFFALVVGEHIAPALGRALLWPLLMIGSASVFYWWLTEAKGHGDLRAYVLVQYLPIALIPLIIMLFPSRLTKVHLLWIILAVYAVAKVFELTDVAIYRSIGISGHTLKHIVAAVGMWFLALALQTRTVVAEANGGGIGQDLLSPTPSRSNP
jgi:hypothetical protein